MPPLALGQGLLGLLLPALGGCGPSFQAVYDGDVRFEHCYALDESSAMSREQKEECWRDWTKNYTYGQTRDKIEYAVSRRLALARVAELPTDDATKQAAPGEGIRKNVITAPMPTSAFAPPPTTLPEAAERGQTGTGQTKVSDLPKPQPVPQLRPPAAECTDECTKTWQACKKDCVAASCDACDGADKTCVLGCMKEVPGPKGKPKKP
jgi:hypothetical protein